MDKQRVLAFSGEVDLCAKEWVERELEQIERFGAETFTILDFTRLRYADTTLLNALLRVRNRLVKHGSDVRMCLVAPRAGAVRQLFEITKLDVLFPVFDDVGSARRSSLAGLPRTLPTPAFIVASGTSAATTKLYS